MTEPEVPETTGLRPGRPYKTSRGLCGTSQYSVQILIYFIAYIFQFLSPLWVVRTLQLTNTHVAFHDFLFWSEWSSTKFYQTSHLPPTPAFLNICVIITSIRVEWLYWNLACSMGHSVNKRTSRVHGANMGTTWVLNVGPRWAPCWPHEPGGGVGMGGTMFTVSRQDPHGCLTLFLQGLKRGPKFYILA